MTASSSSCSPFNYSFVWRSVVDGFAPFFQPPISHRPSAGCTRLADVPPSDTACYHWWSTRWIGLFLSLLWFLYRWCWRNCGRLQLIAVLPFMCHVPAMFWTMENFSPIKLHRLVICLQQLSLSSWLALLFWGAAYPETVGRGEDYLQPNSNGHGSILPFLRYGMPSHLDKGLVVQLCGY